MTGFLGRKFLTTLDPRGLAIYAFDLVIVGTAYYVLANVGLTLAAIHSTAIPIWLPTGLAVAAVLLRGIRVWPAIFCGGVRRRRADRCCRRGGCGLDIGLLRDCGGQYA